MNMTHVLHRRSRTDLAEIPSRPTPSSVPPTPGPPGRGTQPPAPWPTGAKVLVAVLVVATVLATVSAAVAFTTRDDGTTNRQLRTSVAALTQDRDDALARVARLDGDLADVQQQLQAALDGNEELADRADELAAQVATLTAQRVQAVADAEVLTATISELEATVDNLTTELSDAGAERDVLARLFPMSFDASLVDSAMVGGFDVDARQVRCSGLASCGKAPAIKQLTISRTTEGWLWLKAPALAEGGLSRSGGALHLVTTSSTAVPACDGVQRKADVTMTMFPGSFRIAADGVRNIVDVGAVITVQAPSVGGCPAVLAIYSAELAAA